MDDFEQYVLAPRDLAAMHFRSSSVIEEHCDILKASDNAEFGKHAPMLISSAMLRAFSGELALKSLGYLERSTWDTGHNLQVLFDKQSEQSRTEITKLVDLGNDRTLNVFLSEIADVFFEWRYIHDKFGKGLDEGFETGELKVFVEAVLSVLDRRIKAVRHA